MSFNFNQLKNLSVIKFFRTFDKQTRKKQAKAEDADMEWEDYQSLETIYAWIDEIQAEFPNWITVEQIGTSYEGRPLKVVKLSKREVCKIIRQ